MTDLSELLSRLEVERLAAVAEVARIEKNIAACELVLHMLNPVEAADESPAELLIDPSLCPHCEGPLEAYGMRSGSAPRWYCRPCNKTIARTDSAPETPLRAHDIKAPLTCSDCGGPRSAGSGKRCKECYKKHTMANTSTRGEVQCPKCQTACSRRGKTPNGTQKYSCRNSRECGYTFAQGTVISDEPCACGRPANHVGMCAQRHKILRTTSVDAKPEEKTVSVDEALADADKRIAESRQVITQREQENIERHNSLKDYKSKARREYGSKQPSEPEPIKTGFASCGICRKAEGDLIAAQPHCEIHGTVLKEAPHNFGSSLMNG